MECARACGILSFIPIFELCPFSHNASAASSRIDRFPANLPALRHRRAGSSSQFSAWWCFGRALSTGISTMSSRCGSPPSSYWRSRNATSSPTRALTGRIQSPGPRSSDHSLPATRRPDDLRELARHTICLVPFILDNIVRALRHRTPFDCSCLSASSTSSRRKTNWRGAPHRLGESRFQGTRFNRTSRYSASSTVPSP